MKEWNFEGVWVDKLTENTFEVECSVYALSEQTAREKAFEHFMRMHKVWCKDKEDFNGRWYYGGLQLMYVIPADDYKTNSAALYDSIVNNTEI